MSLLFVLASIVVNHKATSGADVMSKIIGALRYAPDKIGASHVMKSHEKSNHKEKRD